MRIRTIRLNNQYKRFHDLTIDLGDNPKKIIALVGPNGSGKSSVFDGMLYLQNSHDLIGAFKRREGEFHSMTHTPVQPDSISIQFDTGETYLQVRERKNQEGKINTIFNFRNPYRYHSDLNVKQIKELKPLTENRTGASTSVDLDEKMLDNYQRIYIYLNKIQNERDLRPSEAKSQILGELNGILSNTLGIKISSLGDIQSGQGTLFFEKENQPSAFPFNVLSSGEKEVVDLLLDIYLRRNDYSETIYIIDEPELHLNTAIQKQLLIELEKLIPDTSQLWVATHSIGFLNALQNDLNDKSDIIDFSEDLSREAKTLSPLRKSRGNWQRVFQTALEDLTGLMAPSRIIYCEGRADPGANGEELGVDADVYNTIFSETHPETLFVSSGGHNIQRFATIALTVLGKAFRGVNLLILKDRDMHFDGTPTTPDERRDFLASSPIHRMLIRKEIENYLFDFEIVSKAFPQLLRAEYDAALPDINSDDVKDRSGALLVALGNPRDLNREALLQKLSGYVTPDTVIYQELRGIIFNE